MRRAPGRARARRQPPFARRAGCERRTGGIAWEERAVGWGPSGPAGARRGCAGRALRRFLRRVEARIRPGRGPDAARPTAGAGRRRRSCTAPPSAQTAERPVHEDRCNREGPGSIPPATAAASLCGPWSYSPGTGPGRRAVTCVNLGAENSRRGAPRLRSTAPRGPGLQGTRRLQSTGMNNVIPKRRRRAHLSGASTRQLCCATDACTAACGPARPA